MRPDTSYTMGRSLGMRLDMVYAMESIDCLCIVSFKKAAANLDGNSDFLSLRVKTEEEQV